VVGLFTKLITLRSLSSRSSHLLTSDIPGSVRYLSRPRINPSTLDLPLPASSSKPQPNTSRPNGPWPPLHQKSPVTFPAHGHREITLSLAARLRLPRLDALGLALTPVIDSRVSRRQLLPRLSLVVLPLPPSRARLRIWNRECLSHLLCSWDKSSLVPV